MPLTDNGFNRLTFDEILTEQIAQAKLLFGDDIDTSDQSVFGKILRLYCLDAANNQELAEQVYLSAYPNTASGVNLDRLLPFAGITRNPATYAQHTILVTGTAGAVVGLGFLVASGDVVFHTVDSYTIGSNGTVSVTVECNEAGTVGNVPVGSITQIVNPVTDITSIQHTAISQVAVDAESDYELRLRFAQAFATSGSGTVDAIRAAILRVSGVDSVLIEENDTNATSSTFVPAHSVGVWVHAPQSSTMTQAIGQAIYEKKPVGIGTYGGTTATVTDTSGQAHTIKFSYATEQVIYVKATIATNGSFSADSIAQIQQNIVDKLSSYAMGQDVTVTSLYGAIYIDGVTDVPSLTISTDGETYSTNTISIAYNAIARTIAANVEVTVQS